MHLYIFLLLVQVETVLSRPNKEECERQPKEYEEYMGGYGDCKVGDRGQFESSPSIARLVGRSFNQNNLIMGDSMDLVGVACVLHDKQISKTCGFTYFGLTRYRGEDRDASYVRMAQLIIEEFGKIAESPGKPIKFLLGCSEKIIKGVSTLVKCAATFDPKLQKRKEKKERQRKEREKRRKERLEAASAPAKGKSASSSGSLKNGQRQEGGSGRKDRRPGPEKRGPGPKVRGPGLEDRGPGPQDRGSGPEDREQGLEDRGPGADDLVPGAEDREPGAEDREPGPEERGPGPEDRGPGPAPGTNHSMSEESGAGLTED